MCEQMRRCGNCGHEKSVCHFSKKGKGYQSYCRLCNSLYQASRPQTDNPEWRAEYNRQRRRPAYLPHAAAVQRAKRAGTWTRLSLIEMAFILDLYEESRRLTRETGVVHHVDHKTPLSQGGKHLLSNLQILTAEKHMKKTLRERAKSAKGWQRIHD